MSSKDEPLTITMTDKMQKKIETDNTVRIMKDWDADAAKKKKKKEPLISFRPILSLKIIMVMLVSFLMAYGIIGMIEPGGYLDFISDYRPVTVIITCAIIPVIIQNIRIFRGSLYYGILVTSVIIGFYTLMSNYSDFIAPPFAFALGAALVLLAYKI